jgi:hypothetical protein
MLDYESRLVSTQSCLSGLNLVFSILVVFQREQIGLFSAAKLSEEFDNEPCS